MGRCPRSEVLDRVRELAVAGGVDHLPSAFGKVHAVFLEALFDPGADLARVAVGVGPAAGWVTVLVDDVGTRVAAAELGNHARGPGAAAVLALRRDFGIDLAGEVVGD